MKKTVKEILAAAGYELTFYKSYRTGTVTQNVELAASNGSKTIAFDFVYQTGKQHKLKEEILKLLKLTEEAAGC